jgi:RNA-directed DNA polymerase
MSETARTPMITPETVDHHAGDNREFLRRCQNVVGQAQSNGQHGHERIALQLYHWITDERNLRAAWDHLSTYGGHSPGPNGLRYADLSDRETWSLMRCLRDAIRSDLYRLGPVRKKRIPKLLGNGYRTLWLQNVEDRVVARAIVQIIQPILDPRFDKASFGFRPGLSRIHALATADAYTTGCGSRCWIVDDGKDAFDQIPRSRLLDVLRLTLPDDVSELINLVMTTDSRRGVRQGSPLSPLLLNVYLDHMLDKPWRREHSNEWLIRSADDILISCGSVGQAQQAYSDLEKMMTATGMPLKGNQDIAIQDLSRGQTANWLGYQLSFSRDDLVCRIADRSWTSLAMRLEQAHSKPCSPLVANQIIEGWFDQLGPCFRHEHIDDVVRRLRRIASGLAFDEIPTNRELRRRWQTAFDRWCDIRNQIRDGEELPLINSTFGSEALS